MCNPGLNFADEVRSVKNAKFYTPQKFVPLRYVGAQPTAFDSSLPQRKKEAFSVVPTHWPIFAFQNLHLTSITTSRLPENVRPWVKVNQESYIVYTFTSNL